MTQFGLLGPLRIEDDDGDPVVVDAAKPRVVLAALLLHANHSVALDRLIEAVWDEHGARCLGATRIAGTQVGCNLPTCAGLSPGDGEWQTRVVQ